MTFSLPSTSCLLKLPTDTALRTANWPRLNMTNNMTRHRMSALYGAGVMELFLINIQYPHFLSVVQLPFDNWHSSFSPTTFFEIAVYVSEENKMALNLEICGSGRAHAQITNVQCWETQCNYHMEEITGTDLFIYRN